MKDNKHKTDTTQIVPMLYLKELSTAIAFYKEAFGASERWRIDNADGSTHVAELLIANAVFRLHEEVVRDSALSPSTLNGTTIVLGLLVDNPDEFAASAIAAGAREKSPVQNHEYGYRQGSITDPFGQQWSIERLSDLGKIPTV